MFEFQSSCVAKLNLKAANIANEWKHWKEQFKMFLRATKLEAEDNSRKVALLLHHMGAECFDIANSFNIDYDKVVYEDLVKKFDEHFVPKLNIAMERHKFFTRKQTADENLESYVAVLKNLSMTCEFGEIRESLVKDIFICGMSPNFQHIKERLLSEGKIELERAVEISRNIEAARENASQLLQSEGCFEPSVNLLKRSSVKNDACGKCGLNHKLKCPAYNAICHRCNKKGHFAKMCFTKQLQNQYSRNLKPKYVKNVYRDGEEEEEDLFVGTLSLKNQLMNMFKTHKNDNGWIVQVKISNKQVDCQVDTGADTNILSKETAKNLGLSDEQLQPTKTKIYTFIGVITKVEEPTEWVNSIVLVTKPNGQIRLCLDPRHLNKAILRPHLPFPNIDDCKAKLSGSKYFSTLDASSGFWMIPLDDDSSKLCTFNTPFGRYKFLRLPFGISVAPEIFHGEMVKLFGDIGEDMEKIESIVMMPVPKDVQELQRFLGMDFAKFCNEWGITHKTSSPYLPRSNGLAERSIQTVKKLLNKCKESNSDPYMALLHLRTTPKENMPSPAELLMSRILRTKLPSIAENFKPKLVDNNLYKTQMNIKISKSVENYNKSSKNYDIKPGKNIMFKKNPKSLWFHGEVVANCEEPRSFVVRDDDGVQYRRSEQHIRNSSPLTSSIGENVNPDQNTNTAYVTRSGRKVLPPKRFEQ
ncbi:Retrovirus-related Pol polyprotein from transposon 412 [Eumeta japonica]|uniref:Retrovirus-related Pol polyprotein from transposon 412 n=1 Tax=Eumeta variegata TaxID=151549 RepID=A0A4C1SF47_EUMVA|nr:Retrovirus-related Pol polyprotein from transposon 412 [Eumeta japonica]